MIQTGEMRDECARLLQLGALAERMAAGLVEEHERVVLSADRVLCEIGSEQWEFFTSTLVFSESVEVMAFCGKADAKRRLRARRHARQNIDGRLELQRERLLLLFHLLLVRMAYAVIGDGRDADEDITTLH